MNAVKKLTATLAVAACAAACAPGASTGTAGPRPGKALNEAATIEVENNNWQDIAVYAVHLGSRVRLGTVTSMSKSTFRLPSRLVTGGADFRLLADPIGGGQPYVTESIRVRGGQEVAFDIQNLLTLSSVAIWERR